MPSKKMSKSSSNSKQSHKAKSRKSQRGGTNHKPDEAKDMHVKKQRGGTNHKPHEAKDMHVKKQRGGDPKEAKGMPVKKQRGGSPASSLVMEATTQPPLTNDYFPRTSDNTGCQAGGSEASDMVMSNLNDNAKTMKYPESFNVKGNINSLNTYEINGGKRNTRGKRNSNSRKGKMSKKHSLKNHKNSQKHKNKNKNSHKNHKNSRMNNMRGGYGSAWIASQYSLGNINNAGMDTSANNFSASQGVARDTLMNPPTLGLAGSGYAMGSLEGANVNSVGAPLV